ncbi:hypothetical protein QJ850_gp506 [Acanthamoeba polyphaga mimivirus]|uniref:Uncharacterized protein n=1 Tax=Acanthamoeba polyphaga mimivirus Kroon TaxID=3069720 RepID=A0A0G2Y357_9VIRU|nr:hypothetical protein QJ850_gp506 [Acanthamoeba polyphaga mimivirus]AKI80193.1 hypothetical protein [Acanthamoeba polyphaga mimivirus Kroon]
MTRHFHIGCNYAIITSMTPFTCIRSNVRGNPRIICKKTSIFCTKRMFRTVTSTCQFINSP